VQNVSSQFPSFDVPFLIIHGSTDKICAVEGSQDLLNRSPSKDKQIKVRKLNIVLAPAAITFQFIASDASDYKKAQLRKF